MFFYWHEIVVLSQKRGMLQAYPTRMPFTIDSTEKESQKGKMVKEDGLNKLVALDQRLRAHLREFTYMIL